MELQLGLLADAAHADQRGKLYILGEFRYLFAEKVPAFHPKMVLVLRIVAPIVEVRGKTPQLRLEFTDADGQSVMPNPAPMKIGFGAIGPADRGVAQAQVMCELGNLPVPHFGDYSIHIWVDKVRIGDVRYHVMKLDAAAAAQGAPEPGPEQ